MSKLGEVFVFIRNGANIKQGDDDTGYPITRIETISNRNVNRNKMGYAGITDLTKYCDYILQDGDILMSHINSEIHLGKSALYRKQENETIIHGMNLLCLRPDYNKLISDFAYYYFSSDAFIHQIPRITKKSVNQASFTVSALKELSIPTPTLETQRRIAATLDKVTRTIDLCNAILEKLDLLVKARFIEMFGDPVYNTNSLPVRCLGDLGEWASGGTPSRAIAEYFEGNINWYSAGELNSLFLDGSVEKITEEAIIKSSAKLFKAGSMLIGMYDTAAFKMGIIREDSASNQACACITPNNEVNIIWLYYTLQMMKDHFLSQRRGVRQKNLNLGMIKNFEIPIADIEKQNEFKAFVEQTDKSKIAVQNILKKAETLKKALMQEYFG